MVSASSKSGTGIPPWAPPRSVLLLVVLTVVPFALVTFGAASAWPLLLVPVVLAGVFAGT